MRSIRALVMITLACAAACSSSSSPTPSPAADSGAAPVVDSGLAPVADSGVGVDASDDGGFDFVFTNGVGDILLTTFRVAPVMGSFCMGTGPVECSFTGSVTDSTSGCTAILNAAFVGGLNVGTAFPIVSDASTPENKADLTYTEVCNSGSTKTWKGLSGTLTIDAVHPPAAGLVVGTVSFSVKGATLSPAPIGAGAAQGSFSCDGRASNVTYE